MICGSQRNNMLSINLLSGSLLLWRTISHDLSVVLNIYDFSVNTAKSPLFVMSVQNWIGMVLGHGRFTQSLLEWWYRIQKLTKILFYDIRSKPGTRWVGGNYRCQNKMPKWCSTWADVWEVDTFQLFLFWPDNPS